MSEFEDKVRKAGRRASVLIEDRTITPDEVLADSPTINEKVHLVKHQERLRKNVLSYFRKARSANDVFADTALDMAKLTVLEAHLAYSSSDRQRAMESVLNRALGKPVDRIMSIAMQVASKTDMELDHDISRLLRDLGYQAGEGKARQALAGGEGEKRASAAEDFYPESGVEWRGVPRKIYSVTGED